MFTTIRKVFYSVFIFIVIASTLLAGWTAYSFISQPSKSDEILRVIKDMYASQKSVVFDFVDLTTILIKENDLNENNENINLSTKKDLLTIVENNSQLIESPGNEDNSLGTSIEPSLNEFSENKFPENIEEPLVNEEIESSMKEFSDGMDMNP